MINRISRMPALPLVLAAVLVGCTSTPLVSPAPVTDTRLDQLLSRTDESLAGQAQVRAQLQEQQQQLELQQQQLQSLTAGLEKTLKQPVASSCPPVVPCPKPKETSTKLVVGALEEVWLPDPKLALTARIDTGAETSSLDAHNIELFERDGRRWVRFEINNPKTGKAESLERRLRRTVGIQQSGASETKRRPVVRMGIVIGRSNQTAEFTLSDRSHLGYQILIGRNILKDVMVVDVSKQNAAPYVLPKAAPDDAGAAR
jgi:hypothetical protein